jgi:hypothetical protein
VVAANTHRSTERSAAVLLRFSPEDRDELKRRAHSLGLTVQDYADLHLLDRPAPPAPRSGGRPPKPHQNEELPLGKSA